MKLETFVRCSFCGKHHGVRLARRRDGSTFVQVPAGTWVELGTDAGTMQQGAMVLPLVRCDGCLGAVVDDPPSERSRVVEL